MTPWWYRAHVEVVRAEVHSPRLIRLTSASFNNKRPLLPCFRPLIFHPDVEANRLKSLGLRADEFLHPTPFLLQSPLRKKMGQT